MPTSEEIAWAAGLFEGEGCIALDTYWTSSKRRHRLALSLGMTDEDVVTRFVQIVGVGRVRLQNRDNGWVQPHWRDQYLWEIGGRKDCLRIAAMFLPYLGTRRRKKLVECLSAMDTVDLRSGKQADWADELIALRKALS